MPRTSSAEAISVQSPVGPTQDRLVAESHSRSLQLTDTRRHALGFIIQRLETTNLGTVWPFAAFGLQFECQHAPRRAHMRCHRDKAMHDLLGRAIVDAQLIRYSAGVIGAEPNHVFGGSTTKTIDRLPCIANDPKPLAISRHRLRRRALARFTS